MSETPSFSVPAMDESGETTGRYVITFRDEVVPEGLELLREESGIRGMARADDFPESGLDIEEMDRAEGAVFPQLGIAIVNHLDDDALTRLISAVADETSILAIEPERIFYAIEAGLSAEYLRGYRDAVNHLYQKGTAGEDADERVDSDGLYEDDNQSTWGLKATEARNSRFLGRGVRVAVLDTGMDLHHPDFKGRVIVSKSFIRDETVQDENGHGTHCIGTACGGRDNQGLRYGVASESSIYAGKVLSNAGSGTTSSIIAGMEWAIANRCRVISMSLGNQISTSSTAYETVGRRALQAGCLTIAAAGNHRPGTVGQPANSLSIMAVGAVNNRLRLASFSCGSGVGMGANVDIAAPGVQIYASYPLNKGRYATLNGTSMATPHVAGIAALYTQANEAKGHQLWQLVTSNALRLAISSADVGNGLVQAPF